VNHDPHLDATGGWTTVAAPCGSSFRLPAPPLEVDGVRPSVGPVPEPGAHTEEILAAVGLGQAEIQR
jgi:crotonobetainyl-CoA:carnitine CoA-transferase CaiB-like acyl-CoA transferase